MKRFLLFTIYFRSTSGRISSASRSTSVTPKIPAKMTLNNSTDTHNSTASSGSHILSTGAETPHDRTEVVDVHSAASSLSGSRSLGSPKPEHSSTPDGTIDTQAYLVGGGEEPSIERGAHSNLVVTNEIVIHNQNMSSKQSPVDLKLTGDGSQMYSYSQVDIDKLSSELYNVENVPDIYREKLYSSLGRDSKKSKEKKENQNGTQPKRDLSAIKREKLMEQEHDLQAETQREIENLIASVQEEKRRLAEGETFMIELQEDIPAGSHISVSVGVSSRQSSPDKQVVPILASPMSQDSVDFSDRHSTDLDLSAQTSIDCDSYSFSSLANSEDLMDAIPYILHRRHYSEDAEEENEENDIVSPVEPRAELSSIRRSRSLKKKRPTNIQVEQVKVYASSEDGSPSPQLHQRSFSCGTKRSPHSRSPSEKGLRILKSRSPSGKRTPGSLSQTSLDRSPSGAQRRNYFTLPPRDAYSSIDDTTSPVLETDFVKCIRSQKSIDRDNSNTSIQMLEQADLKDASPVVDNNAMNSYSPEYVTVESIKARNDLELNISNDTVSNDLSPETKEQHISQIPSRHDVAEVIEEENSSPEKSPDTESISSVKEKVKTEEATKEKVNLTTKGKKQNSWKDAKQECVDLLGSHHSDNGSLDNPSPAAVYLLSEGEYHSKVKRSSSGISFSTFKPSSTPSTPGSRPQSYVESDKGEDTVSLVSSATDSLSRTCKMPEENVFRPTSPKPKSNNRRSSKDMPSIRSRRKVSFPRERGYKYSFESVNDPPYLSLPRTGDISLEEFNKNSDSFTGYLSQDNCEMIESDTTESSNGETDQDVESSDDDRHAEFLKFAKSLADSGKEITADSGVGADMENSVVRETSPLEVLDCLENSLQDSFEYSLTRNGCRIKIDVDGSSSDSEQEIIVMKKRCSADPLEDLENLDVAEVASSTSSSSSEGRKRKKKGRRKTSRNQLVIPMLTISNPSSPEENNVDNKYNEISSNSVC